MPFVPFGLGWTLHYFGFILYHILNNFGNVGLMKRGVLWVDLVLRLRIIKHHTPKWSKYGCSVSKITRLNLIDEVMHLTLFCLPQSKFPNNLSCFIIGDKNNFTMCGL